MKKFMAFDMELENFVIKQKLWNHEERDKNETLNYN